VSTAPLPELRYRVGTYATFRRAMLDSLARQEELTRLTARRSDDFGITVLELWAAVADVLAFYQERYANEAYLPTARRLESVARLAALLGYRRAPGAAALARLAFTMEAGKRAALPVGLRVQSLPGPGELPQLFETLEPLDADARLNVLRIFPQPTSATALAKGRTEATLDRALGPALSAGLAAGHRVVVFKDQQPATVEEKTIAAVRTEADRAIVTWAQPVERTTWDAAAKAYSFARTFRLFGHNAPATYMHPETVLPRTVSKKGAIAKSAQLKLKSGSELRDALVGQSELEPRIVWRLRTLGSSEFAYPRSGNAEEAAAAGAANTSRLCLDARLGGLAAGTRLLVADTRPGGTKRLVTVVDVDQAGDVLGAVTDSVTRVTVTPALGSLPDRRGVVVYELGHELALWAQAYAERLTGNTVYVPGRLTEDGAVQVERRIERGELTPGVLVRPDELAIGRRVVLADASGQSLAATINAAATTTTPEATGFCHLVVPLAVEGTLDLETASATLRGNVAQASHGETIADETLGNGDASTSFQRFRLRRTPLTLVPGSDAGGLDSSLSVFVDGVRWEEVPELLGREPDERVFTARLVEDDAVELGFGDGVAGARLPTGRGNVHATYRVGTGLAGRVPVGALTTALDRPPGLLAVTNPLAATGGADPEATSAARRGAPRTVRTFGRAISLSDVEDLVTASGEVAKAQATWTWDGLGQAIHVTVAAQAGGTFSAEDLRRHAAALDAARDANHPLRVANVVYVDVVVRVRVGVEPDRRRSDVETTAREALLGAFAFDALQLGRPVGLSDVYAVLQAVPGVAFVDVDELRFKDAAEQQARRVEAGDLQPVLLIRAARPDAGAAGGVRPAELPRLAAPSLDATVTAVGGLA
jgi:predicted phage baseplate assembly protein